MEATLGPISAEVCFFCVYDVFQADLSACAWVYAGVNLSAVPEIFEHHVVKHENFSTAVIRVKSTLETEI